MSQKTQWYKDAGFGLFIHWGAYSVAGVEASWPIMAPRMSEAMFKVPSDIAEEDYFKLPEKFNPVEFKPDEWVQSARNAGMKYIIFTSKHHDGFCMFDAPGTSYKITNTPYGRDICLELAEACRRADMPLGFYYSPPDMNHPGYRDTSKPVTANWTGQPERKREWADYLDYMESHIVKLLTDYGKISVIWFDGLSNHGKYQPERFHKLIRKISPDTLINDRLGDGYDFLTPEQFIPKDGIPAKSFSKAPGMEPGGDSFFRTVNTLFKVPLINIYIRKQMEKYSTGELELSPVYREAYPEPDFFQPWETCMTIGSTWAFNPSEKNWKASSSLIENLVAVSAKGGNYLLNIGPDELGRFPSEAVNRLKDIGTWINKYGEFIYGSNYTGIQDQTWGYALGKGNNLYFFVKIDLKDVTLELTDLPADVVSVKLSTGKTCDYKYSNETLTIPLAGLKKEEPFTVIIAELANRTANSEKYSPHSDKRQTGRSFLKKQVFYSLIVNSIANGLIAFFSYINHSAVKAVDGLIDSGITAFIIGFIVAWLLTDSVRKEVFMHRLKDFTDSPVFRIMPGNILLRSIVISFITSCLIMLFFWLGISLSGTDTIGNNYYILIKTMYTGISGAIAALAAIGSVLIEHQKQS